MKGRKKFLIGGLIILVAIGSLGFMAFRGAATFYFKVSEISGKSSNFVNQNIRVEGQVATGSLEQVKTGAANLYKFTIVDDQDANSQLPVSYQGALPDTFKEGNDAVVEGRINSSGYFEAQQIIVKCPSKYAPATPAQ